MDDKNLNNNPINSELIRDLSSSFANVNKQEGLNSAAQKQLAQQADAHKQAQKQLADSIESAAISLTAFGSSLSNNASGDFNVINRTIDATTKVMGGLASMIPYVGGALDGITKGAGEVAKFMVTTFARAYGNFEKLSDTGVIVTFKDLRLNSDATGMTFADTAKIMGQYSKELAVFGGNALAGAKRFQNIANDSKGMSEEFQRIGISVSEFSDFQLNYINQQTIATRGQALTDRQLEEGTRAYVEQLDTLAKMTGQSRREIQGELNERLKNTRYVAAIAALPEKIKATIDGVITNTRQLGPEVSESLIELVSNSGVANSDDARALRYALSKGGVDPKFYTDLKQGRYSADEANKIIMTALGKYSKTEQEMAIQLSNTSVQTRLYVAGVKANILAQKQYIGQQGDIEKNRRDVVDSTDSTNTDLAKTRRSMYGTTRNIDALATSSDVMTKIMNGLADSIDAVTEELYNFLGDDIPEYIRLRREENKKQTELNAMRRDLNKQLELEAKLKTVDPDSKEAAKIKDQLATIRFNNYNWGKLLTDQIKTAEDELRSIQTRRVAAETQEVEGTTPSGSAQPAQPSGAQPGGAQPGGAQPDGQQAAGAQPGGQQPTGAQSGQSTQGASATPDSASSAGAAPTSGGGSDRIVKVIKSGPGGITVQLADGSIVERTGTVAWRGNNPGNLRYADWEKQYNAVGIQNAGTSGAFAVFATLQDGINAQKNLIFNSYANLSLSQLMSKYDYATAAQYTNIVSRAIGVSPNTIVGNLNDDQRSKLINAIHQHEGFRPGSTRVVSGPAQPSASVATAPASPGLGTSQAAVVSGPTTGYPAVLSGNTAVIPANPGSEAAAATQTTTRTTVAGTFEMMNSKLDRMIDIANTNLRDVRRTVNV